MKKILFLALLFINFLVAEPRFEFNQTALDDYVIQLMGLMSMKLSREFQAKVLQLILLILLRKPS